MTKRNRGRGLTGPARPVQLRVRPPDDLEQIEVESMADELAALWRVMPHAVARDSSGQSPAGDRQPSGVLGSLTVNVTVVDAAVTIEAGLRHIEAQAVRLLRSETIGASRRPLELIAVLPRWRRLLAGTGSQPLADHIHRDLKSWVRELSGALGTRRLDEPLGVLCPNHRDEKPTPLLRVGDVARLAPTLLAGPPSPRRLLTGACRGDCQHRACRWTRERRFIDEHGRPTDWIEIKDDPDGDGAAWSPLDGSHAFTWDRSNAIRCPRCKRVWADTTARRMLERELAGLAAAQ